MLQRTVQSGAQFRVPQLMRQRDAVTPAGAIDGAMPLIAAAAALQMRYFLAVPLLNDCAHLRCWWSRIISLQRVRRGSDLVNARLDPRGKCVKLGRRWLSS